MIESLALISIIMPAYNVEPYISDAIKSILAQSYRLLELIIIDDGSTDASLSIAQYYANLDSRIKVISQKNKGLSSTRNTGLKISKGKYIYFFDSDDVLKNDTFSICINHINNLELDLITFSGIAFSTDINKTEDHLFFSKPNILTPLHGQDLLSELISINSYSSSACLYLFSRHLIESNDLLFDEGFIHEDEGFTPLLYCVAERSISLENRFFMRRIRSNSIMTSKPTWRNIDGCIQAVYKIEKFLKNHNHIKQQTSQSLRKIQRQLLRRSIRLSDELKCLNFFTATIFNKLGKNNIFLIDPATFFYITLNKPFIAARSIKRKIHSKALCLFH